MKKIHTLFIVAFLIIAIASLLSCKSSQPPVATTTEKKENLDSVRVIKLLEKNAEINDSMKILIGKIKTERKECDSVCQVSVNRLLSQLNSTKSSGNNATAINYNEKDNSLNIATKIGATANKTDTIYINKTTTLYSTKEVPVVTTKPLPRWMLILMLIGTGSIVYWLGKVVLFIRTKIPA